MLGSEFFYRDKIPVAILGATGSVGQKFVELLADHPWFEIAALAASERSAGKRYGDAVNWLMPTPLPSHLADIIVRECNPDLPCKLVFSGLDSAVAGAIETRFAEAGFLVISNASNHRMNHDVPLLIPEVNIEHLELLHLQAKGKIVTNPNCCVTGLCLALKPLVDTFGLEAAHVVTFQAVSGAGYPGVPSLDILDNVIPYIKDEEKKVETEPHKIFGTFHQGKIEKYPLKISAQCNRVPVTNGHLECVSVKLKDKGSPEQIIEAWRTFSGQPQALQTPMAPEHPLYYFSEDRFPQPKLHRGLDKGMAVSIGRLQSCSILDYKFVILSHNTIRGAAGGAILNAELLVKNGFVFW